MKHRIPSTSRTFRLGAVIQFVYSRSSSGVIWYVLINKGSTAILLSIYLSVLKTQCCRKAALPSRTHAPERGRFSGHTSLARSAHPPGGFLFHRAHPMKQKIPRPKTTAAESTAVVPGRGNVLVGNIIIGGAASLITRKLYRLRAFLTMAFPESSRFLYDALRPSSAIAKGTGKEFEKQKNAIDKICQKFYN